MDQRERFGNHIGQAGGSGPAARNAEAARQLAAMGIKVLVGTQDWYPINAFQVPLSMLSCRGRVFKPVLENYKVLPACLIYADIKQDKIGMPDRISRDSEAEL